MFPQQELYLAWSSLELFMVITHLCVLLGFRNSNLKFLRRQQNYFLLDGFMHLINILLYFSSPGTSYAILTLWSFAFIVHLYYYRNLKVNPIPIDQAKQEDNSSQLSHIFHWSCLEYNGNRFNFYQSGKAVIETSLDCTAHFIGFYYAFQQLHSGWYKIAAIMLMTALFYRQMLRLKYFVTDPKMMPKPIQQFFKNK